jgi:hypothetical protein
MLGEYLSADDAAAGDAEKFVIRIADGRYARLEEFLCCRFSLDS